MLKIDNLTVCIDNKEILSNISLEFKKGAVHAIMGRNGCGKSTLSKVIAGHPDYEVISGDILVKEKKSDEYISILDKDPDERAHFGIFIGFQNPVSIAGLDNESFLRTVYNNHRELQGEDRLDAVDFHEFIQDKMNKLGMSEEFLKRGVNSGFSGGERKKNEMIQLALLTPRISILDEIDSGLDIDALSAICKDINSFRSPENTFVLVTHYNRILQYIKPDFIHVLHQGKVVITSDDSSLAQKIEERGFDFLLEDVEES